MATIIVDDERRLEAPDGTRRMDGSVPQHVTATIIIEGSPVTPGVNTSRGTSYQYLRRGSWTS